jgi:hypothetical protein
MSFKKRRIKPIVISILALILISGYVLYRVKKDNFLDHQLQKTVKQKTNQLYNIHYDSISVDEIAGNLYVKNIYIKGDTSRQMEMINNKDTNAASILMEMYIPMLKVVGFKTAKALLSKQMDCSQIIISNPTVQMYIFPQQGKKSDEKLKQQELYKQILGNFKLIKADSVSVLNAQVVASDFFTKEVKFKTFNTTVNLNQLAIDSSYNQDTTRTLFCKEIGVKAGKVQLGDKNNTAQIQHATFNTRSNVVTFSSITYDAFKNDGFFKTKLEGISLEGITWQGPVENSDLIIHKVIINKGGLETLSAEEKEAKDKPANKKKILTGWIKKFALNTLQVKSVNYINRSTDPKKKPFVVTNNSFSIHHIEIDRTSSFNEKLVNNAKEIQLNNEEISIRSGDKLYEYKLSGIKLNTKTKTVLIKSVRVIPQLNEEAFAKKAVYQTDRYNIAIRDIRCTNVNSEKLVKGELDLGNITTSGNSIKVFRDLSYPIDSVRKRGQQMTYPQQVIHKLGIPIQIKKLTLANTYVEYKEKNAISKNSGRVRFSNTSLTFNNISTRKPKKGERITVHFKTDFLDSIPLTGGFTFSLDQWQKGVFTASASVINPINATTLNQLTEPMGLVKVEKGLINSVRFYMNADTNTSHGTLSLPYQDLKLSVLKKKGDGYKKKAIISLLANVAVKNNNKEGTDMRTANVVLTRNKYRSFFNFIWMTIFKGIKDVAVLKI